jgi:uncharacterized membrane protein
MHQLDESFLEDGLLRACVYVVLCVCVCTCSDTLQIIFLMHLLGYFVSIKGTVSTFVRLLPWKPLYPSSQEPLTTISC